MIEKGIKEEIRRRLVAVEQTESVEILLAVESGSRAWGFASKDSDYDVRFIYLRPANWYVSIDLERKRDVIEQPITDHIDLSGWDIRKALQLLRKSNPPLIEWLNSPIVYREDRAKVGSLRKLATRCYSRVNLRHHYLNMARRTVDQYLRRPRILHKKYFYALRPLLALRWLECFAEPVPMDFPSLRARADLDPTLDAAIEQLLKDKQQSSETQAAPSIPVLDQFIETELARFTLATAGEKRPLPDVEPLNRYFRDLIGLKE